MEDFWVILLNLPLMVVISIIFGYEPVLYMGIGMLGLTFWLFSDDPILKRYAFAIFIVSEFLFVGATIYYITIQGFTREDPFNFKFLFFIPSLIKSVA